MGVSLPDRRNDRSRGLLAKTGRSAVVGTGTTAFLAGDAGVGDGCFDRWKPIESNGSALRFGDRLFLHRCRDAGPSPGFAPVLGRGSGRFYTRTRVRILSAFHRA